MNLSFLDMGMLGAFEAGGMALLIGFLVHGLWQAFGRREGWSHAKVIGWAYLTALVIGAGADAWHLLYLGIVPLDAVVSMQRSVAGVHDPDYLSVRVFIEIVAAGVGVMIGWLVWAGALRQYLRGTRGQSRD
ncbi:hypothetical protein [Oleiagrimonas sp. C23AA]|uniref:hypothetical protein n=1 Tax=Oleiagrimonas sp. C23AA TaxID=2719047 RepID=UPI0014219B43|nr:hypothetical protein [Oleiagrimonas sp. C23AA]NII09738.1 hypothetical protein [Oleiagrimonas sp. C23AA]